MKQTEVGATTPHKHTRHQIPGHINNTSSVNAEYPHSCANSKDEPKSSKGPLKALITALSESVTLF